MAKFLAWAELVRISPVADTFFWPRLLIDTAIFAHLNAAFPPWMQVNCGYLRYASCRAVSALLPLSYCGQDITLEASEKFLQVGSG